VEQGKVYHISLERGGADAVVSAFPSKFRLLNLSPHPSKERRGSVPDYSVKLRAKWVARGKVVVVGWVEDEWNSTVMGLMWALNSARPHR
jgi:hypothetical protein